MFLKSINWFRGIAIILIVLSHVQPITFGGFLENEPLIYNGTFFFVLIAGFLFYHLKSDYEYTSYMKKKTKYVILPYLFALTPGVLLALYFYFNDLVWFNANQIPEVENVVYYVAYLITHGGAVLEPYWFIPMIVLFFIFSPVSKKIMESDYLGLVVIVSLTFTLLLIRPSYPELSFFHWFGVYFLGGYLSKNYTVIERNKYLILPVSFALFLVVININISPLNFDQANKMILSFTILSFLCILEEKKFEIKWLDVLAKYSFGIFFLHAYISQSGWVWFLTVIAGITVPIMIIKCWSILLSKRSPYLQTRYFFGS